MLESSSAASEPIDDEDLLWRRIAPAGLHQETPERFRPNSLAFQDNRPGSDGLSVHLARLTTIKSVSERYPEYSVVEFPAKLPRSMGYEVVHDPTPDDPSHTLIKPTPNRAHSKTIAKSDRLRWVRLHLPVTG